MPTEILPTRRRPEAGENVQRGFLFALLGHLLFFGAIAGAAWIRTREHSHWGESNPTAGAIQASMVNALPLPPRQRTLDKAVLTSDKPNIAPTPPPPAPVPPSKAAPVKPKAEPLPKPDEIAIPSHVKPPKPTPKTPDLAPQPVAPRRVTPPPAPTPKATTGETAGVQIPQSITPLRNGTASVSVPDRVFGDRYAYYIRLIAQKINQQKAQDTDPPEAKGKRAMIHFVIDRDGTPGDVEVETRSGSSALDTSTLRAIQRIDTFGPLPAGDHLAVTYIWDSH